jgi:nitrogenase iron protein NifH
MSYAKQNLRVLQIGCDPKHDSTIRFLRGKEIATVMDLANENELMNFKKNDIVTKGIKNIDCIECGGPKPGVGCAGRGISLMAEILNDLNIINSNDYDVVIFDVLGDVVCGGFAAPLKLNFGEKIFIIISEELASLYAANNISRAIKHYEYNGIYLGGLILNLKDNQADLKYVYKFAKKLNTNILAKIPRSKEIVDAEYKCKTVIEEYPSSVITTTFTALANKILTRDKNNSKKINPIKEKNFYKIFK